MAKDKQKAAQTSTGAEAAFDWSQYLPEGYAAEDLQKVGSLTPIYSFQNAYDEKWAPVIGLPVEISMRDMGKEIEDPKQRFREFLTVELKVATKATRGSKDEQEIVDLEPGQDILVPMGGNIRNIRELRASVTHAAGVPLVALRVEGQLELRQPGKPSPMWVVDVNIHPKLAPRTGRFTLAAASTGAPELPAGGNGVPTSADGSRQAAEARA